MAKRYTRINWQNKPNTATPLSAANLNKMDKGIKDCDDAIGDLALLTTNNKTDLVSAINEQNNNLAYTLKLIGKTPGDADLNATPFTVDLALRGSWLVSVTSETIGIASNGLYIISTNSDKALITPILQNNNIDVSYNGGTLTVKALDTAPYKWGFVSVYRLW